MDPILSLILTILVILLIAYGAFYIIGQMGLPQPARMVVLIIVGVLLLIALLGLLPGIPWHYGGFR